MDELSRAYSHDQALSRPGTTASFNGHDYDDMVALGGFVVLPEPREVHAPTRIQWSSATHAGHVRMHNEDCHSAVPSHELFVLADGMGGYNAGEVASDLAVKTVQQHVVSYLDKPSGIGKSSRELAFLAVNEMRLGIQAANKKILDTAAKRPECLGMGTTVVAAGLLDEWLMVAHVGDSRLYRWRDGQLQCLTRDHSVGQEMIEAGLVSGEQSRTIAARGILTRAVGAEIEIDVDVAVHAIRSNDIYLLCSDGLTDMVDDQVIAKLLSSTRTACVDEATQALLEKSLQNGGTDNISVIIFQVGH